MSISGFVKRIRDIMRNDAGINGDAQRIEQIAWMLFLKVYDEKENDWDIDLCGYPHQEEEILAPQDLIKNYRERRASLDADIDRVLGEIMALLGNEE